MKNMIIRERKGKGLTTEREEPGIRKEGKSSQGTRKEAIRRQKRCDDPFENMKSSESHQHRKSPSLSNLMSRESLRTEKTVSKSLSICKSENTLPGVFRPILAERRKSCKRLLPPIMKSDRTDMDGRCVSTPFFHLGVVQKEKIDEKKEKIDEKKERKERNYEKKEIVYTKRKNSKSRFFDHIKRGSLCEISFGEKNGKFESPFRHGRGL
jgi:hypothetical protein